MTKLVASFLAISVVGLSQQVNFTRNPQINQSPTNYFGADHGTGNTYVGYSPGSEHLLGYVPGTQYTFTASHTNTGQAYITLDGLGDIPIVNPDGSATVAGQIQPYSVVTVVFTQYKTMQLMTGSGSSTGTTLASGLFYTATETGGTTRSQSSKKLGASGACEPSDDGRILVCNSQQRQGA